MTDSSIEIKEVIQDGRKIQSVGNCPKCEGIVEYRGKKKPSDGWVKNASFMSYCGTCLRCGSDFFVH